MTIACIAASKVRRKYSHSVSVMLSCAVNLILLNLIAYSNHSIPKSEFSSVKFSATACLRPSRSNPNDAAEYRGVRAEGSAFRGNIQGNRTTGFRVMKGRVTQNPVVSRD